MKFRPKSSRRVSPTVDLTPLIDVVFQLLIFFMLSATFVVQSSIQIEMPEAEGTTTLEQKDLSITLAYGTDGPGGLGPIYVDNEPVASMEELKQVLGLRIGENPDLNVLLRPDKNVSSGRLIEVLGISTSLGIEKTQIAAQQPEPEE